MSSICRVCLSEGESFVSIFSETGNGLLSEKIMFCATVQVNVDDHLPSHLCPECMAKLDVSYNFRRQSEAADNWLRENLGLLSALPGTEEKYSMAEKELRKQKKKTNDKSDTKRKSARITAKQQSQTEDIKMEFDGTTDMEDSQFIKEEDVEVKVKSENSLSQDDDDLKCNDIVDFVNDNDNDSDYFGDKQVKKQRKHSKKKDKLARKKKKRGRKPKIYYDEYGDITLEKPPVRYCCEHCGKYFTSGSYLKVHSRIHLGVKAFECPTCGKKFSTRDYLRKHARTHSDVKLYKCQYCPKGFNDWGSRQKHERIHRKEKPYVCDICGKRFTYSYTMTKHKLIHSGLKNFSCDICKRTFTMKYHLKSHQMRIHKELMASQTQPPTQSNVKADSALNVSVPSNQTVANTVTTNGLPVESTSSDITDYKYISDSKQLDLSHADQLDIPQTDAFGICLKSEKSE